MVLNKDFQPYQHNPSSQTIAAIGNVGVEKHMLKNMSAQMLRYGSILEKQRKRAQSGARLNLSSSKSPGGGVFKNRYDQHDHHYGLNQVDNDTITLDDKLSHIRKERKKKVGGSQDYISLKSKS